MRLRIARKEAKETRYWLPLLDTHNDAAKDNERDELIEESTELMLILSTILRRSEGR